MPQNYVYIGKQFLRKNETSKITRREKKEIITEFPEGNKKKTTWTEHYHLC